MTAVLPEKFYPLRRNSTNFDGRRTPYARKVSIWPHQDRKSRSLAQSVSPRLRCGAAVNLDTSHAALEEFDAGTVFSSTKSQAQMHFGLRLASHFRNHFTPKIVVVVVPVDEIADLK